MAAVSSIVAGVAALAGGAYAANEQRKGQQKQADAIRRQTEQAQREAAEQSRQVAEQQAAEQRREQTAENIRNMEREAQANNQAAEVEVGQADEGAQRRRQRFRVGDSSGGDSSVRI